MAVVFQDAGLFNRSIAENIRIGRPDATRRRGRGGREARRGARVHRQEAGRLRVRHRRARRLAVGRRAPAHRHRPRHPQERADPDPRRGHQRARRGDGGAHQAGARPPAQAAAPPSSSPTASRPSPTPTRSWCSTAGASSSAARSASWSPRRACSPGWWPRAASPCRARPPPRSSWAAAAVTSRELAELVARSAPRPGGSRSRSIWSTAASRMPICAQRGKAHSRASTAIRLTCQRSNPIPGGTARCNTPRAPRHGPRACCGRTAMRFGARGRPPRTRTSMRTTFISS